MKKSLMVDARILATFANLESAEADSFRHAVAPGFVPELWWTGQALAMEPGATSEPIWQMEQDRLREVWRSHFSPIACLELIVRAAKQSETEQWLKDFSEKMGQMSNKEIREYSKKYIPQTTIYPYQHVVMLLALQPWRARICEKCGKYFVKDKPRDRYCSRACSKQAILDSKRKSWEAHSGAWRPKIKTRKLRKMGGQ